MLEQYLAERSRRRKRAAEYSLSLSSSQGKLAVDLGIKKDRARGRKNNSGQRKKKIITHKKSIKKIKRLKANLKLAKVVLQLGVIVYKDVLPVVGALAVSSGEMLKEKVVPAIKQLGHSAKHRAGRMADYTIQTLHAYAPLVKETLKTTLNTVVGGVKQVGRGVTAAAKEFKKRYSSALGRLRERRAREKQESLSELEEIIRTTREKHQTRGLQRIIPR